MMEELSLEETNKIRISLGLKPLTDDKAPTADKEKQAEDNFAKQREQEAKDREAKKVIDRIAKVRNRRELNASLKGATLGDADADADDTLKWVKKNKKKEKERAKKRQEELENMDKIFQDEYTERDLAGLKVAHDFDDLDEGEAKILTLKDSRILDNEEDELQNVEMAEKERHQKNQELKKKRKDYTGYDDDEFIEGKQGMKRSILAKYDEELEGTSETGFRLGSNVVSKKVTIEEDKQQQAAAVNKELLTIDYIKNVEIGDYLKPGDIGFKKPKTKKKRPSRRAGADAELAAEDEMQVDEKPKPIVRDLEANFVDDDELQAALARTRRAKLRKPKKLSPEELAAKITSEKAKEEEAAMKVDEQEIEEEDDGLTFDETSEFIRAVGNNPMPVKVKKESTDGVVSVKQRSLSRDVSMAPGDEAVEELEAGEVTVKDEDEDEDMAMLDAIEDALKAADAAEDDGQGSIAIGGTSTEQTFSSGMVSTLTILRQQGILATPSAGTAEREKVQLQRDLWLANQRHHIAQRELARLQSRGGSKDQATREYENRLRDQQEARENLESFKNYKPDINIVYYDEYGRSLTPKEAWKALSHKFHGKGSGKMKTEKRLKKIAEEKKQAAMVSGDTPLSMNQAFQQRQLKTGQAHFVLSVGNRGAVPQMVDYLETQPLSKGKTEKAKKKKEAAKKAQAEENGFITLPAPQLHLTSNGEAPGSGFSSTGSPAPAMKPGFSRISSVVESPSQTGTPPPGERSKVTFGFGLKRKAGDDAEGSPSAKRRET